MHAAPSVGSNAHDRQRMITFEAMRNPALSNLEQTSQVSRRPGDEGVEGATTPLDGPDRL